MSVDKDNPYFSTDFSAYNENLKWQSENNFNNQQAWDARLYGTWEREQTQLWNEKMWEQNNEYNSIGSQIDRARAAGVNPASIVAGDYKSAQSSPVTSSPQSPVQAHAGSSDAQRMSAITGAASAVNDSVETFLNARNQERTVKLGRDQLNEAIRKNTGELKLMASQAGVQDATKESIYKSLSWADSLNYTEIMQKRANIMSIYNDNYIAFARLAQDAKESDSRIAYNAALTANVESSTEYQELVNKYADKVLLSQASIEEIRAYEYVLRKQIAQELGVPMGSPVHEFNYAMIRNGMWFDYVDTALRAETDASLKPSERIVPYSESYNKEVSAAGFPLAGYDSSKSGYFYVPGVIPGHVNPTPQRHIPRRIQSRDDVVIPYRYGEIPYMYNY